MPLNGLKVKVEKIEFLIYYWYNKKRTSYAIKLGNIKY